MQRRQFCTAVGASCLTAVAGCMAIDLPATARGHPFADSTLGVRVENRGETDHDVVANAQEALDFWSTEHSQYLDFAVDFEIVEASPDIVLAYVDTPEGCSGVENYSEDVLGCAPLIRPGHRVSRPVTAYVVAADRPYGSVRTTAKHELGHILGLGHDDDPRRIMSNRPEDRIELFAVRIDIWETALAAHTQHNTATQALSSGIAAWNDERYAEAVEAFDDATTAFEAGRNEIQTAQNRQQDLTTDPPLETVDYETLTTDFEARANRLAIGSEISTIMGEASQRAADGERSTARGRLSEANELLGEFRSIEWAEIRTVAVALGLVRGFSRRDDGVDVGDEEL